MKKKKKKELNENKQTKGEARGKILMSPSRLLRIWSRSAACLKIFIAWRYSVFYCGRGMSLRVQMIQDLSTIKTLCTTLPHQTTVPSKLNPKIPQQRNGNKTGFGCSFPLVTSSDRRNRRCWSGLRTQGL